MSSGRNRRPQTPGDDQGFTLIEVVVSLSLLAILATASLYFFLAGTRSVTHLQRSHDAVALANDAMEGAFSWVATASTSGTSGLVVGRTQADVTAAWAVATAAGISGVAQTFPAWDTATAPLALAGTADDVVPLTTTATESRTLYSVTTLIGTCYRLASGTNELCTTVGGNASGTPLTGYIRMMRTIVTVSWPNTAGSCAGSTCRYQIASIIDPNSDVEWNNTTRLLAVDDAVAVDAGSSTAIDVLSNDTLMQLASNPVSIISGPGLGSAVVDTSTGKVTYTALPIAGPGAVHGEVTFTYRVMVGARQAQALAHIYVTPQALSYAITTYVGTPVTVNVTDVTGVPLNAAHGLFISENLTPGVASAAVSSVSYATPGSVGSYSFKYTYVDPAGMTSLPGTVRVTVVSYTAPVATPLSILLTASNSPANTPLVLPPGQVGYKVRIVSPPTGGAVTVDSTQTAATYRPPVGAAGTYTFTYQMLTPDGVTASPVATATVTVLPDVNDEVAGSSVKRNQTDSFGLSSLPSSGVVFEAPTGLTCGSISNFNASNGHFDFKAPGSVPSSGSCSFSYRVQTTGSPALWSDPATYSVRIKN
ncbi:Ig-like domain-containing protein [Pengzhenrongella phosphoraccumulans]|uniref:Ig-like domain-containing protein n=1 Tax=Pengzhenrongella phosphoraccumulans TaxID=3114394 RepID=UPI00388DC482